MNVEQISRILNLTIVCLISDVIFTANAYISTKFTTSRNIKFFTSSLDRSKFVFQKQCNSNKFNRIPSVLHLSMSKLKLSKEKSHVLVVGSANYDLVSYTSRFPEAGETVLGKSFETFCGGKGANQAVAAANLEFSKVSILCKLGADSFGDILLKKFRTHNVQVLESKEGVQIKDESTGVASILVDDSGENSIVVCSGTNTKLSPATIKETINSLSKSSLPPSHVLVQLEINMDSALEAIKSAKQSLDKCTTILNPAPVPPESCESMNEFYQYTDIIVPNQIELRNLCGYSVKNIKDEMEDSTFEIELKLARELLSKGVGAVIVTLGAEGAMVVSKEIPNDFIKVKSTIDIPTDTQPVVDTVGAGDCFCGSLASYLSTGMTLENAAQLACGVASMSVRKQGAQSSYPLRAELPPELIPASSHSKPEDDSVSEDNEIITFVTGNKKKVEEIQRLLQDGSGGVIPYQITNRKLDLPELQGEPEEIAIEKCKLAATQVDGPVLIEDTSLCFNSLNGLPGPYIKWFLEKTGHDGLNNLLANYEDKGAYAQTIFSLWLDGEVHLFVGKTDGNIVPARGALDFGWDPIFEPIEGEGGRTYAEMTKDEKNRISHRGKAFLKLKSFLIKEKRPNNKRKSM